MPVFRTNREKKATGFSSNSPCTDRTKMLRVEGLCCIRGGRLLLDQVTFQVRAGGILSLEGANGVGKTSVLRILAGFLPALVKAMDWGGASVKDNSYFLGTQPGLSPFLTVLENLLFWAILLSPPLVPENEIRAVEEALGFFSLESCRHRYVHTLSEGEKQRVSLARLLFVPHAIWLLDEPFKGLDHQGIQLLTNLFAHHQARGGVAIVASPPPMARLLQEKQSLHLESFQVFNRAPLSLFDPWINTGWKRFSENTPKEPKEKGGSSRGKREQCIQDF